MNRVDHLVDLAADRLQELANEFAGDGGTKSMLAEQLADDAAFIRKLKPSLMLARWRGDAAKNGRPGQEVVAPSGPQLGPRPKPTGKHGPNPFVVVGVAAVAGIAFARFVDWRVRGRSRG